jgi:hypothetical protein
VSRELPGYILGRIGGELEVLLLSFRAGLNLKPYAKIAP